MRKSVLFIVSFIFVLATLFAQNKPFINYTTHDGLPQIQVQYLYQDSKGYIWIGTKGGLAKFNGEKFETYLKNEYIFSINESKSSEIYIGTRKGIYHYYKGKMKVLESFNEPTSVLAGNDEYWIFDSKSIREYKENKRVKEYPLQVLFSQFGYVNYYDTHLNTAFFQVIDEPKNVYTLSHQKIKKLTFDDLVQIQKFENGSVYLLLNTKDSFIAIHPFTRKKYFEYTFTNKQISSLEITQLPVKNHLYNLQSDVVLMDSLTQSFIHVALPILKTPYATILDKDNNYWVGTDNGLYQIGNGALEMFPKNYMNDVWTLIKGTNGLFYTGEYRFGLFQLDFRNKSKTEIITPGLYGKKEVDYYYSSSKDLDGNLYFPTQNGVVKYDYQRAKKLDNDISIVTKYDELTQQIICGQENGFAFFDAADKKTTYKDATKKILTSRPTSFEFTGKDKIWIGTWEHFVGYNRSKNQFQRVNDSYLLSPPEGVVSMHKDFKNNIWIGATDGLWLYEDKSDTFQKIGNEIFQSYILDVKTIKDKFLLVGTSQELYIINLKEYYESNILAYKMYNYRNGFVSEEIAQNGFLVDDPFVYIPSTTVTSVLNLEKVSFHPDYFNVYITSLNGEGLDNAEQKGIKEMVLKKSINQLEIIFEAVGFGLPTQSKFQYKLEGVDDKWSEWNERNFVNYYNLKSGKYIFKVRAYNGSQSGERIIKENHVDICISLPIYKEPYFYKLAFFLLLLFIAITAYTIYVWYKNSIKVAENERKLKFQEIATLQA